MKNLFLLSTLLLGASALSANAQDVLFDFSKSADINQFGYSPLTLQELRGATYTNASGAEKAREYASGNNYVLILEDETISKDGVSIRPSNPDKYKDYPRYFFGLIKTPKPEVPSAEYYYCDMRWYQTQEIEISAPEGKRLEKIVMDATSGDYPARQNNETLVQDEVGKQDVSSKTLNVWEADGQTVTSVTYKATSGSATQMAYSILVTLADLNGDSAVAEIAADENTPIEYFDLAGVKHNADNLKAGVYVKRQGSKASKVIVK